MCETEEIKKLKTQLEALRSEISALDVAQSSFKVASNSFFGILLLPHFKYYDYRLGEAITTNGQTFIIKSREYLNDMFSRIIGKQFNYATYSDTDSSYINVQDLVDQKLNGKSNDEIVTYIEKLVVDIVQPTLNKRLHKLVTTMGCDKSYLDKKLECIGPSIIFLAKKKYSFDILYSEGVRYSTPKMKVMGIEIVRSSTPNVVKDYLKECLALCLRSSEEQLQKKVREVKKTFMQQGYVNISFPRGVNGMDVYSDSAAIYKKGCPIHVRGSLLYNHTLKRLGLDSKYPSIGDGDKVKFVALKMPNPLHENIIAFPSKLPSELGLEKFIDYKVQFEKAFVAPLENILEAIGWEAEETVKLDFE